MYFEVFGEREGCGPGEIRMGQRKVLMFGSNDYLGADHSSQSSSRAAHSGHRSMAAAAAARGSSTARWTCTSNSKLSWPNSSAKTRR